MGVSPRSDPYDLLTQRPDSEIASLFLVVSILVPSGLALFGLVVAEHSPSGPTETLDLLSLRARCLQPHSIKFLQDNRRTRISRTRLYPTLQIHHSLGLEECGFSLPLGARCLGLPLTPHNATDGEGPVSLAAVRLRCMGHLRLL